MGSGLFPRCCAGSRVGTARAGGEGWRWEMCTVKWSAPHPRSPHTPQHPSPRSPVHSGPATQPQGSPAGLLSEGTYRTAMPAQGTGHPGTARAWHRSGANAGTVSVPLQDPSPKSCPAAGSVLPGAAGVPQQDPFHRGLWVPHNRIHPLGGWWQGQKGMAGTAGTGPFAPWSIMYINIEAVCIHPMYICTSGGCAGVTGTPVATITGAPGPSLEPRVAVEGAGLGVAPGRGAGVEDGHAAAAGADHVGDEAGAVGADVAQDRALGVDVGEFLLHPAPARPRERAAAQGTPSAPAGGGGGERGRKAQGLTGRAPSGAAARPWAAASPAGSRSPARRRGCEPASWKASSSAGMWESGRDGPETGMG